MQSNLLAMNPGRHLAKRSASVFTALLIAVAGMTTPALGNVVNHPAPSAPSEPMATLITGASVKIQWKTPLINPQAVTGYAVRYTDDGGNVWQGYEELAISSLTKTFTGLSSTENYTFQVKALGTNRDSEWITVTESYLTGMSDVVSATHSTECGIKSTYVYCWGYNYFGALGNGEDGTRGNPRSVPTPVRVEGIAGAVQLVGSGNNFCTLDSEGSVSCWGSSQMSSNWTWSIWTSPQRIVGMPKIAKIYTSQSHSCGVSIDDFVYCWGLNSQGEIGDGTSDLASTPKKVSGLSGVTELAIGYQFTCALLSSKKVSCWGNNDLGQLGIGNLVSSSSPVEILNLTDIKIIQSGMAHTCAVNLTGSLYCWGGNSNGQLGIGNTLNRRVPTLVPALTQVSDLATDSYATCAVEYALGVYCWGNTNASPSRVLDGSAFTSLRISHPFVSVTSGTGEILEWNYCQPVACATSATLTEFEKLKFWVGGPRTNITMSDLGYCAMRGSAMVVCGQTPDMYVPNGNYVSASLGNHELCLVNADGLIRCQTGQQWYYSPQASSYEPVSTMAVQLDSGTSNSQSCAVLSDGTVKCWGAPSPGVAVQNVSGAVQVSAGGSHSCAVLSDGTVKCWGSNSSGQLGDGSTANSTAGVAVQNVSGAVQVSAGGSHSCAILSDGSVKCWGSNSSGQLGDDALANQSVAVIVPNVSGANSLSTNSESSCITLVNGNVKCWGLQSANLDFDATISVFGKVAQPDAFQQTVRELNRASIKWVQPYAGASIVDKYRVRWSLDGQSWTEEESSTPSFDLNGLASNQEINFKIAAHNDAGWSAEADYVATTLKSPEVPTGLEQVTKTPTSISLAWDAPASDGLTIDKYKLEWASGDSNWSQQEVEGLTSVISGLTPATTYRVRVSAYSAAGWSQTSVIESFATTAKPGTPTSLIQTARTANSVAFNWAAPAADGISIEKYKVEWSTNGTTWSEREVNTASYTISGLIAATSYRVRVSAFTAAGWGAASAESYLSTSGTKSMRISFVDAAGKPLSGGSVTWKTSDNRYSSAVPLGLTANGVVDFPRVAAGAGKVVISQVVLADGTEVSGQWDVQLGTSNLTLRMPALNENAISTVRKIKAQLPNGLPVPGANVSIDGLGIPSGYPAGPQFVNATIGDFTYKVRVVARGVTDANGEFIFTGLLPGVCAATQNANSCRDVPEATVQYSDGVLQQNLTADINGTSTTVSFEEMPWIDLAVDSATANLNALVSIPIATLDTSSLSSLTTVSTTKIQQVSRSDLAGVSISAVPPSGSTQKCKGVALKATTNNRGQAQLKVCATKSGTFQIKGKGAVATGYFNLRVKGAAPQKVTSASGVSPLAGSAKIAWNAPSYIGGASSVTYTVTLTGGGKTFVKKTSSRTATFSGLKNATAYSVKIVATTKFGSSDAVVIRVPVA